MSDFSGTLTGGIQDLSALLPLIGTEQCEKHVGSALEGGYLYAAAAPLSLFGSPGIVKTAISVLIASISIPSIKLSRSLKPSLAFSGLRWCGARVLDDAGFKPVGKVAPMIAMDNKRYTAESRLIQMLNEKHIDSPENLTIEWKSFWWNVQLVLCTIIAAVLSYTPYIHLVLGAGGLAWVFPLVRMLGSCLASVFCQFLIQSRTISIMKNRIIFMTLHRQLLHKLQEKGIDSPELRLQSPVQWNEDLIAEECLWSLENYLTESPQYPRPPTPTQGPSSPNAPERKPQGSSPHSLAQSHPLPVQPPDGSPPPAHSPAQPYVSIPIPQPDDPVQTSTPNKGPDNPFTVIDRDDILQQLRNQRELHFPNPVRDWMFIIFSWVVLLLAIPAAVAGYIGSFTLASNSTSNGPAIWLGVEVALSIVRILIWAWNPRWDEKSDFTVHLELTELEPLVTTEKDVELLDNTLPLVPEQRFLEFITRYTGPLEQFKGYPNIVLYFTLSGAEGRKRLFMTVLDARMAFVVYRDLGRIVYTNCSIDPDMDRVEMQATLLSEIGDKHPWKINYPVLMRELTAHYDALLRALDRTGAEAHQPVVHRRTQHFTKTLVSRLGQLTLSHSPSVIPPSPTPYPSVPPLSAPLLMKWSFEAKPLDQVATQHGSLMPRPLVEHDNEYLQRGYEHHLKTRLMETWGDWFVEGMEAMRSDALIDCHFVNEEPMTNEQRKQLELDQLEAWVAVEWQKHELALLKMSVGLEEVLNSRIEEHIEAVLQLKGREWMRDWFFLEWSAGRKKRLEGEWAQAKGRMEIAAKRAVEGNMKNARRWWQTHQDLVNKAWKTVIAGGVVPDPQDQLPEVFDWSSDRYLLKNIQERLARQRSPLDGIWTEMEERIKRIRDANPRQLDQVYSKRPPPPAQCIYSRFAYFGYLPREHGLLAARLSVTTSYDVTDRHPDVVDAVIANRFARTVIGVAKDRPIAENTHLLYLGDTSRNEIVLPFIQRNRDDWWTQQTTNSSTFYFTPSDMYSAGVVVDGTHKIAHLMIFLGAPTHLQLRLLHRRHESAALSILEGGIELLRIRDNRIPLREPRLCSFEFEKLFEAGKHELELVVVEGPYQLQNILVEFINDVSSSILPLPP